MTMSYFERAKRWVKTADDVNIENLESTIGGFAVELKKLQASNSIQDELKSKDLSETLSYLKERLREVAGVDELPIQEDGANEIVAQARGDYTFDPSPLVDMSGSEMMSLSAKEKAGALVNIKKFPGIISGGDLGKFSIKNPYEEA